MEERNEQMGAVLELLLREPEIVAWLEDYRGDPDEPADGDDEPPAAA
jgi:hypothetical protein